MSNKYFKGFTLAEVFLLHSASRRKIAFTLAEVLITLGIIGVVAAMTMPALITKYQKKQAAVQLKKVYSELHQAIQLAEITNGSHIDWNADLPAEEFTGTYLAPFVKVSKKSAAEIHAKANYKYLNGETYRENLFNHADSSVITLADGAFIFVDRWTVGNNNLRTIGVDINGLKGPNVLGKDAFAFSFCRTCNSAIMPYLFNQNYTREQLLSKDTVAGCNKEADYAGYKCSGLIIMDNWEINYPW